MKFDVRTYLLLAVLAATCASQNTSIVVESAIVGALALLQLASGPGVFMPRLVVCYPLLVLVQYALFPLLPEAVSMLFSLVVVNARTFFPLIMCIVLLYKNVRVSQMTATFAKMGVPRGATIALAVAIRYIPSLKEEWAHIRDAMRMRNVSAGVSNPFARVSLIAECYLVPLFVCCIQEADELSCAAMVRGIDSPAMPTCRNYQPLRLRDFVALAVALGVTALCFANGQMGVVPW